MRLSARPRTGRRAGEYRGLLSRHFFMTLIDTDAHLDRAVLKYRELHEKLSMFWPLTKLTHCLDTIRSLHEVVRERHSDTESYFLIGEPCSQIVAAAKKLTSRSDCYLHT
jgi:hypothetical protein